MASTEKFLDDGRSDETGRAGNKHAHGELLRESRIGRPSRYRAVPGRVIPPCLHRPLPVQDLFRTGQYVSGITTAHTAPGRNLLARWLAWRDARLPAARGRP